MLHPLTDLLSEYTFPTLQMGSLYKEQPSANDFLPIEMWEAIKKSLVL